MDTINKIVRPPTGRDRDRMEETANPVSNASGGSGLQWFTTFAVLLLPFAAFLYEAFINSDWYSRLAIGLIIALWIAYVGMFYVSETMNSGKLTTTREVNIFFAVASLIVIAIGLLSLPGILWVITMPLVGGARESLKDWRQWLVYASAAACAILPYFMVGAYDDGISALTFVIPATAFVMYFTDLTINADAERRKTEKLALELEDANRQLGEYAVQAEEVATMQERNRIAREIHDNLGHYLTVVNVQLEAAKTIFDKDPAKAKSSVEKAQTLTQEGLQAIRQSVTSLREGPVGERPVPEAIAELIQQNQASGFKTDYSVVETPRDLPPKVALTLYRVVQEALTNARKHSQAESVRVTLDYADPEQVRLSVSDDGVGSTDKTSGFGLLGIRERVALLGGELTVDSAPNQGFRLAVTVPG